MASQWVFKNANGKLVTLINPDTNGYNISVELDKLVTKNNLGNVGIGDNPSSGFKLDLFGNSISTPSTTSSRLSLRDLGGNSTLNFVSANEGGNFVERLWSSSSLSLGSNGAERMRIDTTGNILVTGAGGLGYGGGAGGAVTQLTSKTTAVTLNKPTGRIITANTALAAGASVEFQFNNSIISNTDTVVPNIYGFSGYRVEIRETSNFLCVIRLINITAGSLSEAVQINFNVIKGATS